MENERTFVLRDCCCYNSHWNIKRITLGDWRMNILKELQDSEEREKKLEASLLKLKIQVKVLAIAYVSLTLYILIL